MESDGGGEGEGVGKGGDRNAAVADAFQPIHDELQGRRDLAEPTTMEVLFRSLPTRKMLFLGALWTKPVRLSSAPPPEDIANPNRTK